MGQGDEAEVHDIEQAVERTIRFFAVFDMPVTAVQIWRSLVLEEHESIRWGGRRMVSLRDVQQTLTDSRWLKRRIGTQWGYYYLAGHEDSLERWLMRHAEAQQKWLIVQRFIRWLAMAPFVRALAGSGSLALYNTRTASDLDIFVIARAGRIWTTRLFVLIAAELTGRRRRFGDQQAPDKLCLNHYIATDHLAVDTDIRNLYTAVLYAHLVPLFGGGVIRRFQAENASWIKRHVMYPEHPTPRPAAEIYLGRAGSFMKRHAEHLLLEPIGDAVERLAETIQRRTIAKHTFPGRGGRVAVSRYELAFHPDSKAADIIRRFEQDTGQQTLL